MAPKDITVVEPALDQAKFKPASKEAVAEVKRKYKITRDYLLFVGTMDPRKNVEGIIKAYAALEPAVRDKYQLVLAGAPGRDWGWGWLDDKVDELEKTLPARALIRTGYFANEDKPALMSGATLFVWPSHYEGWGMPVLEAEACGAPVVTARNSSLPEVGGAGAAYVEQTTDPEELTRLMMDLLNDPVRREKMRAAGLEHAKKFTWTRSAAKLADVLRKIAK
jgi:glycosyltransferase involved in cell wall biosynthesis